MSREVQVVTWCDRCQVDDDVPTPGHTFVIGVAPDLAPTEVDLCERHAAAWGLPVLQVEVPKYGRPPEPATSRAPKAVRSNLGGTRFGRKPTGSRDLVCPLCPLTYTGESGLRRHLDGVHGVRFEFGEPTASALYGGRCPLCGEQVQGLGEHCRKVHGTSFGQVHREARKAGDPYGLVAALDSRAVGVVG